MRYRTTADYASEAAHANRRVDELRVHLQRLIVLMHKHSMTVSEQETVALAMNACYMQPDDVTAILAGEKPWPTTRPR
jgi:hypothetical protein